MIKKILRKIKQWPDWIALLLVLTGVIWTNLYYKFWNNTHRIIVQDVILYYEYLPATFIYKDITLTFYENDREFFRDKVWRIKTGENKYVSKMTMGLAVLYSPFFLVANSLAARTGYPADGYSVPYRVALIISSIFYAAIGFIFLVKFLRKYFARGMVAITLFAIGLGTNLYFYTTIEPTMSHAYSFFLFAVFLFLADAWITKQSWLNTIFLGVVWGLIILVRPSNGIIIILFLLWKVDSWSGLKDRIILFFRIFHKSLAIILIAAMIFLPQVLYWKYLTGDYFYYSYGKERFFFNDPVFIKGLFSYRKGWLIYTPIMAFSLLGMIVMYFRSRKFFWPVIIFTFVNMYIVWSWWCWWYGGGFGQRALVESYAVLSVPFAAFTEWIFKRKLYLKIIYIFLLTCFISLNIFQTRQYYIGVIHWDAMNKKAYWDSFFRTKVAPGFYQKVDKPDYGAALNGDR